MSKRLFLITFCGLILASCGALAGPAPTSMYIPPSPTLVQSLTLVPAMLLAEQDLETQTGTAYSMDWSPDGGTLAVASGVEIMLLSGDVKHVLAVLKPSSGALTAAWSPDGKQFATVVGLRNPSITIWDWNAASSQIAQSKQISAGADQYGVSWSPDGRYLASLADDRRSIIQIWDTETWELLNKFELPYANPRRALIWSSDSKLIHDAGELGGEAVCFALNVENGDLQELGKFPAERVYAFTISPDSKKVAVADESGIVRIYEIASGKLLNEFQSVDTPVDLAWDPTGQTFAVLGYKTRLQLWDVTE